MTRQHYVVFGAGDRHDKAVIIGKSPRLGGYEMNIVQLKDGEKYKAGETIDNVDICWLYTTLYFTRFESLKALSDAINKTLKEWENDLNV